MKRLLAAVALSTFLPLCAGAADAPAAAFEKANAAFAAGRYDDAAAAYRALADTTPRVDVYFNLGTAEANAGRLGPAVWAFEQALVLDPADDDARHNLESVRLSAASRSSNCSSGASLPDTRSFTSAAITPSASAPGMPPRVAMAFCFSPIVPVERRAFSGATALPFPDFARMLVAAMRSGSALSVAATSSAAELLMPAPIGSVLWMAALNPLICTPRFFNCNSTPFM
jgi:tetratricopeptide (TPR) repeat protein